MWVQKRTKIVHVNGIRCHIQFEPLLCWINSPQRVAVDLMQGLWGNSLSFCANGTRRRKICMLNATPILKTRQSTIRAKVLSVVWLTLLLYHHYFTNSVTTSSGSPFVKYFIISLSPIYQTHRKIECRDGRIENVNLYRNNLHCQIGTFLAAFSEAAAKRGFWPS